MGSSITYFHEPHEPQIERTIDYLQQILPLAEKLGVKLAIENHGDFFIGELQHILEQYRSPFLGITLDTGNCLRLREDPLDAIEVFKGKIFVVHAKDIAPVPGFTPEDPLAFGCVPAGEGITDFPSILNTLSKHDYKGMILIEISRPHPDFEHVEETEIIKKGLHYLMRLREEQEREDATER